MKYRIKIFILANPCNTHITWRILLQKVDGSDISHIGQVQWFHLGNSILSKFWFLIWTAWCIVIIVKSRNFIATWSMVWVKKSFWLEIRPGESQKMLALEVNQESPTTNTKHINCATSSLHFVSILPNKILHFITKKGNYTCSNLFFKGYYYQNSKFRYTSKYFWNLLNHF